MRAADLFGEIKKASIKSPNLIRNLNGLKTTGALLVLLALTISIGVISLNVSKVRDDRPRAATTVILRPAGVGGYSQFDLQFPSSGQFVEKVNEVVANGDTTYIEATNFGPGDKNHSFDHQLLNASGDSTIESVKVYAYAKKIGTANSGFNIMMNDSQLATWGGYTALTESYALYSWTFPEYIWGGLPWTVSRINDVDIGVNANIGTIRVSQIYLEVTYSPPPADTSPPTTPTGLTVTGVTDKSVSLDWNDSTDTGGSGLAGYKLFRDGVQISTPTTSSYTNNGLNASTTYSYYVRAYDNAGNESGNSATVNATTNPTPKPNLYISNLVLKSGGCGGTTKTSFADGESITVCGTLGNNGATGSSNAATAAFRNQATQPPYGTSGDYNATYPPLSAGYLATNTGLGSFTANYSTCTNCTAAVFIDSGNTNDESNETDNFVTQAYTVAPPPDTTAPVVTLTAPTNGAFVSGNSVGVSANADDNIGGSGVARVDFYLDSSITPVSSDTILPYTWTWDSTAITNGSHTVSAKAVDVAGNVSMESLVTVTVDNQAPTAAITSPANNALLSGSVSIFASATDNTTVSLVEFFIDGVFKGSDSSTPYSYTWDTTTASNGVHNIYARATDAAGNATNSVSINVTVDRQGPALTITAPTNGSTLVGIVAITVTASDADSGMFAVEFLVDGVSKSTDLTSPYSYSWDTTTYLNSSHSITVNAYDNASNVTTQNINVTVNNPVPDTTPPSTPTGLSAVAISQTQVNLTWNASTDNVGVTGYKIYRDGVYLFDATGTSFGDGTVVAGTSYAYRVSALDAAGNESFQSNQATVVTPSPPDTQNPVVTITNPANGSLLLGTVNFTTTASDNVGVTKVVFFVDGVQKVEDVSSPYAYSWNTALEANGSHTLLVNAHDAAGNIGTHSITVTTDNQNPSASITSPANNAFVNGTVSISASASDNLAVSIVDFYIDGVKRGSDSFSPYAYSWDSTTFTNGAHTIYARATDTAGNFTNSGTVNITVDNASPTVSLTAPSSGSFLKGTVSINATAADNTGGSGLNKVEFLIDGTLVNTDTTSPYSYSWNTTTATNGAHTLTAKAYDVVGNPATTSSSIPVTVDNASPTVSSITSPTSGAFVRGNPVTINATAADNAGGSGMSRVELLVDGTVVCNDTTTTSFTCDWNTTVVTNGSHTLTAKAYDVVDNPATTSSSIPVTVDNASPTVSLTAPTAGSFLKATVNINATAADNAGGSGLSKVEFLVDGTIVNTDTTSPYSYSWNTTTATNGSHTLTAKAYDVVGNSPTTSTAVTVTVDNQAPTTVVVTSPSAGTTVSGSIDITATATDNSGVTNVEFLVDGVVKGSDGASPYSYPWDTTTYSTGNHSLTVIASDAAGNSTTSSSVVVNVDNTSGDTQAPSVPANLVATAIGPTQINLTWTASTDNVGVVGYNIIRNGVNIGSSSVSSYGDGTVSPGTTYNYKVSAFDAVPNTSAESTQVSATTPAADTTAPVVSITDPPPNAFVSSTSVTVSAAATDNVGVTRVEFYMDNTGTPSSTDTIGPDFSWNWNTTTATNGSHSLTAKAFDAVGNSTTSLAVTVKVDNAAPSVSITAPADGATVSGAAVSITATAADNETVASLVINIDGGSAEKTCSSASCSYTWDTTSLSNGVHTISVTATDVAGNTLSDSNSVNVSNIGTPVLPSVVIKANGSNGPITIVYNQKATLSWSFTNSTVCVASGSWSGTKTVSSSQFTGSLTVSKTYTLTCTNAGGSKSDSVTVKVGKMGDLNLDGKINIRDLSILVSKWGKAGTVADINADGKVNIRDLSILVSRWGR